MSAGADPDVHAVGGDDHRPPPSARSSPAYRLLTGPDDDAFCRRVSEALAAGYELHGSPAATFDGVRVIVAQALVLRRDEYRRG